jgi:hypothetical protein
MKYQQPNIVSSFRKNNLGETLYNTVLMLKPVNIVEFGSLHGYSAICMAMALHELKRGHIFSYDTWKTIDGWGNGTLEECKRNADEYGVGDLISFGTCDIEEWIPTPSFNLLYVDVNNDGRVLSLAALKFIESGADHFIFEGGSKERDEVMWMEDRQKINGCMEFTVIDKRFPSLSMFK